MADSPDGIRVWPTTPDDLADIHKCPGCFTPVSRPICPVCGFALTDPRALVVLDLGRKMLAAESERQRVIEEVRRAQAAAEVAAYAASLVVPAAVPGAVPGLLPTRAPLQPWQVERPAPTAPAPREPRPPRRRLSVPVLLLIVGVSLVGVAAIFFMVYAWFTWGVAVRALIIGAITVATIAIASLLRRRSLTATAEGIAVLGVVLLALDAWAVRANDFFGTGAVQPAPYAGVSILVIGVLCRVWATLSRLRSPDIAAVLALPIGLGLVVGGAVDLPTGEALVAGLLSASIGGLAHALPAPWSSARARADAVPERVTLVAIGVAALVAAAIAAAIVSLDSIAVPLWSGAAIIALGAAHTLLLRPTPTREELPARAAFAAAASGTAAAVATLLGWQLALRGDLPVYTLLIAPVIAVAVPVLLDRLHARIGGFGAARITAFVLGAISIVVAVSWWAFAAGLAIVSGWVPWVTDAVAAAPGQAEGAWYAPLAGVLIAALLFLAPTLDAPAPGNARIIAAVVLVLSGAAVVAVPSLLVAVAAVLALSAVVLLTRPAVRLGAGTAAGIAGLTAFVAATATPWLWLIGIVVAAAVPIAAHVIVRPSAAAGVGLTLAPIGILTISAFLAPAALAAALGAAPDPAVAFALLQWVAMASVLAAVLLPCPSASRTTLAVSGYTLFMVSLAPHARAAFSALDGSVPVSTAPPATLGDPALALVRTMTLLVLFAVIALGRSRVEALPALGAAVLVAPTAAAATFSALQVSGLDEHDARALATVGAAIAVVWAAAVWSIARTRPAAALSGPSTRSLVDLGALATTLLLAWDVAVDLRGVMLAVIAAGFVGASIARGWAAPATELTAGVPSTRSEGLPLAIAPRRLLVWPAFAFATAALWSSLWTRPDASSLPVEAFVIAPAAGLLAFAVLLVWLRRHAESSVAVSASFLLGLAVPAVAGWTGSPVRGTVVALVAAGLALALTWTPALRARIPALSGATTALFALALVAADRALEEPPADSAWLLLLVGLAYAAALGATRRDYARGRPSWFAMVVPPIALVVAVGSGVLDAQHPPVLAIALALLGALHVVSAAIDRAPFGAATRWSTLAGAAAFAVAGFVGAAATIDGVSIVELVSLPVALIVLAGSAVAQWRRHREGVPQADAELAIWLGGLVIAVLPSVLAPVEPLRVWLTVVLSLAAALIAVLLPIDSTRPLRSLSAVVLAGGALAMGGRTLAQATFASADAAVTVAGAGAIAVAAAMIWKAASRTADEKTSALPTVMAVAGAALLIALVIVQSDGELVRTSLTATLAAAVAVGGAALLGLERWRGLGAVLAVSGLIAALTAIGARLIILAGTAASSIEPDFWAVIALGVTGAIGVMALRATAGATVGPVVATVAGVAISAGLLFFTAAELVFLGSGAEADLRTVFAMSILTVAGVAGVLSRSRLGWALPITAAGAALVLAVIAILWYGVEPLELVTVPPAVGLTALGARALHRSPQTRSWSTLGPGLALLTVPSLAYDFGDSDLWRVVALGAVALALVVVGAVLRLQAPLVLGSVVLLIHAVAQLWPWIRTTYEYVPWWLWLGIGGALLIFLAARYEKNMRALRSSVIAVTSLR